MSVEPADLPQQPTRSNAVVESVEWMFEPAWKGERLMARLRGGRVTITDENGRPARDLDEAAEVLEPVLDADEALIDGIWTEMSFIGEGSAARHPADATAEEAPADEPSDRIEDEPRRTFVAVDLVELDGQPLHDVPYLERRRLLASVIAENARVRISPAVRLPIDNWLAVLRTAGFGDYVAKHVNSRYRPGEVTDQWLQIPTVERRGPSPLARLLGARARKVLRIEDDASPNVGRNPRI
jgi:bifunctional non-homologous end joining protein LigD